MKPMTYLAEEQKNSGPVMSSIDSRMLDNMESIACGVQARLEENTGFSLKVIDETVNTARTLGVANEVIARWATKRFNRLARETERLREIRVLLDRNSRPAHTIMTG